VFSVFFFFQAEDGIRDVAVTGVQKCDSADLMVIKKYHEKNGEKNRNVCLIPSSAHGTNPASAQMVGMKVVVVKCDQYGNVDYEDLKNKAANKVLGLFGI